ncbi:hypothetical protein FEK33_26260 [Nocardia asteroides NBRC 15531]|uniref:Chaperone protein DnaK n=1 Tax=Nocardia asteroides NBRC 15531 TaxID=1110697 RepID=U5ELQ1_NOCAS|nr:Hsp70 family protein [Nocardia asteroides]TLF63513.1 hypothetical protein FEK33_26260 [Nocardia asteroides NBRC 15531]UGT47039.1 Hsp70 family protein [Nocardia asteroides]SFM81410.1 Hsp70 protein [Nocardia asteroides]VEG34089.1 chaperone protein HscA [Nocardia asteroides]GAD87248.1 hypothetical protein NCAST_34_03780 [Nocardia asteroides NBRC 15531]
MPVGWGISFGARNSVCVSVGGGVDPAISVTRATVEADDGTRILGFGDLTAVGDIPCATAADLVATALGAAMAAAGAVAERAVLAYPAVYSARQLTALRQALDRAGLAELELIAEPIAAAAALDGFADLGSEDDSPDGANDSGALLVYDLGASSLDLAVLVRDSDGHRVAGRPVRSYEFGGRACAAAVAEAAHDLAAADHSPGERVDPARVATVRAQHVRDSLPLVRECLRTAGVSPHEVAAVLLVGGAATPADVAHTLADLLRCSVVRGAKPAETIARGAALLGAARPAVDGVLVPVRRPRSRGVLIAAAIAVPLGIPAVLGLLRIEDGRPGNTVAAPVRVVPAIGEPGVGGTVEPRGVPGWPERPLTVSAVRWSPAGSQPEPPRVPGAMAPDPATLVRATGEAVPALETFTSATLPAADAAPNSTSPGRDRPLPFAAELRVPSGSVPDYPELSGPRDTITATMASATEQVTSTASVPGGGPQSETGGDQAAVPAHDVDDPDHGTPSPGAGVSEPSAGTSASDAAEAAHSEGGASGSEVVGTANSGAGEPGAVSSAGSP